jgi:hypothetical protein
MSNGANALCWGDVLTPSYLTAPGSLITASIPSPGAPLEVFELPGGTGGQVLTYAPAKFGCNLAWCDPVGVATPGALGLVYGLGEPATGSVSVGQESLNSLTTGLSNTALGVFPLRNLTEGNDNVAVGFCAGQCLTTESNNVSIGSWSGGFSTYSNSVLVGACSGYAGGTGSVVVGYAALASSTLGVDNSVIIGSCALNDNPYSGNQLVAIGPNVALPNFNDSCQLAIGFSATDNWLTGDCTKAIKPGAGVIDCAGSCGTAGQVIQSTGSNAIQWASPAPGYTGYNAYASSVTTGTKFNVTGWQGELGANIGGQLNIFTTYDTGSPGPYLPGSNVLIFINGFNGVGTSTVQAFDTSIGTFAVESVLYPANTDITVTFTPSINSPRVNFYIRFLDAIGFGGPANGNFFTPYLTVF